MALRSENIKGLCISVSAATPTQDVVNPTFKEKERALRLGAGLCDLQ